MAEQLLVLADNLFDLAQYPNHVLSANEEASGYEVDRVASGRRYEADRWQATTANADAYVQVRCDHLRAASCLALDRNSNLLSNARAGNTSRVQLLGSNDNFTTSRTVLDVTLATVPGGAIDAGLGCVTDEDAWLTTFAADAFHDWRLVVKALGSGVVASVGGVWLGLAFQPTNRHSAPGREDENTALSIASTRTPYGWQGRDRPAAPRSGTLHLRERNTQEEDMLTWHVMGLWVKRGAPAWLVHQRTDRPARALLAHVEPGLLAWDDNLLQWPDGLRVANIPWTEDQVV